MNKPTFLIVGAAKSGTTSVYHYLKQHPQIFLPIPKEPKYITSQFIRFPFMGPGDDLIESRIIKSKEKYYRLFEQKRDEAIEIGDASADNLYYYEQAIPLIKKEFDDPKILIFLRDPVQRAFSAYAHLVREGREHLDFIDALDTEEERIRNNYEFLWHYKQAGLYTAQVKAYLDNFTLVKIFLLEDIIEDKNKVVKEVFNFLNVSDNVQMADERIYNVSGKPKSGLLFRLLKYPNPVKNSLKLFFPKKTLQKLRRSADAINLTRMEIDDRSKKYLKEYYRHDVYELKKLLGRNLTTWLK